MVSSSANPSTSGNSSCWKRILTNFLRLFFKLLYHEMAWAYDTVAWLVSLGRWKRWVLTAMQFVPEGCILELGPGTGHLLSTLRSQGQTIFALEESRQMIRITRKRINSNRNHSPETTLPSLILGKADCIPFHAARFDCVISTFPSAFIAFPNSLKQITRVLKPKGKLVVLLSAWPAGNSRTDRFIRTLFSITGESDPPVINLRPIHELLSKNGLNGQVEWIPEGTDLLLYILAYKDDERMADIS